MTAWAEDDFSVQLREDTERWRWEEEHCGDPELSDLLFDYEIEDADRSLAPPAVHLGIAGDARPPYCGRLILPAKEAE